MRLLKGAVFGVLGFALGLGLVAAIRSVAGLEVMDASQMILGGWFFGIMGWLLGVGVWDFMVRQWIGGDPAPYRTTGWRRYFDFDTDHKVIGIQYLVTFLFLFLLAGLFAMLMRWELMNAGRDVMSPTGYNNIMSLHGTIMVFVAVAATTGAFGNYVVPIMIGARDMAFPRLNAVSFWLVPPVVFLLIASFYSGGYDTGWTGYAPLSETTRTGALYFNLAFFTLGLSSILGALNFITTVIKLRAPGMGWDRLPIFTWSVFITSILALIFTQFVALAMLMVALDRAFGMTFFDAEAGAPLLYQHIFWFYSHPAVYIMILPGFGITLEVISTFSRKPLFAYKWAVGGMIGIASLSAVVWAHHMFTSGMPDALRPVFLASTELISIPTGLVFLSAIGTLWQGRIRLTVPMLFAVAVVFNFLIGGLTGVFLADVPVDIQLQDTYFVVAHFHYVILGGGIFALFAAIYYWFPKMTGRTTSPLLGKVHFWWMFVGFNLTFLPMFWLGTSGMNRRIADYVPDLGELNRLVSLAGFFLGVSFVVFLGNYVWSWVRGARVGSNPWGATTLEWLIPSPPPHENFDEIPVVVDDPYTYGRPDAVHAVVGTGPSEEEEGG